MINVARDREREGSHSIAWRTYHSAFLELAAGDLVEMHKLLVEEEQQIRVADLREAVHELHALDRVVAKRELVALAGFVDLDNVGLEDHCVCACERR